MKKIIILLTFCCSISTLFAEPIRSIPPKITYNEAKAKLGKKLFFDTKLSKDKTISCASCHNLDAGGDDGLKFSFGIGGKAGNINAPTVLNSVFNFKQFWNGRAKTLAEQAKGPIENPIEMGHSFSELVPQLKQDKFYFATFQKIYKNGITADNIADAIAEFEKTLITPNAPFDRYLRGDQNAITQKQKQGYELFKSKGCISCHNGINIGGASFAKFGIVDVIKSPNFGLFDVTKNKLDMNVFKVPTLRNVEHTAPYFHDGKVDNLKDAVKIMAYYQIGTTMSDGEVELIVDFLNSLSGKLELIRD